MIADKNFRLESKLFMHLDPDIYVNDQYSWWPVCFSRNFHVFFLMKYLSIWRKKSFLNFKFTSFLFGFKFFSKGEGVHRSGASRLISQALVSVTKFNSIMYTYHAYNIRVPLTHMYIISVLGFSTMFILWTFIRASKMT